MPGGTRPAGLHTKIKDKEDMADTDKKVIRLTTYNGKEQVYPQITLADKAVEDTLSIAHGGTGASDAAGARKNLGLEYGVNIPTLGSDAKIQSSYLPSYVDDVIEGYIDPSTADGRNPYEYFYTARSGSEGSYSYSGELSKKTLESGKIYVDLSDNKTYRWSGSQLTVISDTIALGRTSGTAFPGDAGKQVETDIATLTSKVDGIPSSWGLTLGTDGHTVTIGTGGGSSVTVKDSDTQYGLGYDETSKVVTLTTNGTAKSAKLSGIDTHYKTGIVAGISGGNANVATENGKTFVNVTDDGSVSGGIGIQGSGATTVTSDNNGQVTINSTDTTYSNATISTAGLMSAADKNKIDSLGKAAYTSYSKYVVPRLDTNTFNAGGSRFYSYYIVREKAQKVATFSIGTSPYVTGGTYFVFDTFTANQPVVLKIQFSVKTVDSQPEYSVAEISSNIAKAFTIVKSADGTNVFDVYFIAKNNAITLHKVFGYATPYLTLHNVYYTELPYSEDEAIVNTITGFDPLADKKTYGIIKVGSNLTVSSGVLSLEKENVTAAIGSSLAVDITGNAASATEASNATTAGSALSADVANKLGTATVGSASKPIYLNAGVPTAGETIGSGLLSIGFAATAQSTPTNITSFGANQQSGSSLTLVPGSNVTISQGTDGSGNTVAGTVEIAATDTTYEGGNMVEVNGRKINNLGVVGVATGSSNGTIKVTIGSTAGNTSESEVAVKGLGSLAYMGETPEATANAYGGIKLSTTTKTPSLTTNKIPHPVYLTSGIAYVDVPYHDGSTIKLNGSNAMYVDWKVMPADDVTDKINIGTGLARSGNTIYLNLPGDPTYVSLTSRVSALEEKVVAILGTA